jgi:glycosyltransferase involved in cell wall biosynthesis
MKPPKISVVIPSYNKVRYIKKTLTSIFSQNYDNFEVIVQDGGSTDGTLEIIKEYALNHRKKLIWESKKDGGQLDAINKGMKKTSGELISFINADDMYQPNAFKYLSQAYQKNPGSQWFAGRGIVINENDLEIAGPITAYKNFLLSMSSYPVLLITNYLMQPSVFIKREAYQKYGPFTGTRDFVMEYDMWLKLGKKNMPIIIEKNIAKFRIEATTKTKTMFDKLLSEDEKILKKYTGNQFIIFLHNAHNIARKIIGRFV